MRITIIAATALIASTAMAQDHREAGAHVHGSGVLDIAIEGEHVSLSVEAPAFDIVGFEHEPTNTTQREAIETARAKLEDALTLWGIPEDASCAIEESEISLIEPSTPHGDDHDDDEPSEHDDDHGDAEHDHDHSEAAHDGDHTHDDADPARHSSVSSWVELHCEQIDRLTALEPQYFALFDNAETLTVRVISESGQATMDIDRADPAISLR